MISISKGDWEGLRDRIIRLGASLHDASQDSRDCYNEMMSFIESIEAPLKAANMKDNILHT